MKKLSRFGIISFGLIGLLFLISNFLFFYQRPYLSSISSQEISVGETVVIEGHNLGDIQSSTLRVGGYEVLPRLVKEWTSRKISFVLSDEMSSGLIFVKNGFLRSNSLFFINHSQVPDFSVKNGMGTYLISLGSEKLVPTTEVVLKGRFLGLPSENRKLVFQSLRGTSREISLLPGDLISWTDSEIRFNLPIDISSGRLYLEDHGFKTNALPYIVDEQTARWDLGQERQHNFKVMVTLERLTPTDQEFFYFWLPKPRDSFKGEQGTGTGALNSYSMQGWQVYQISASTAPLITLEEIYELSSAGVQVVLNPDLVKPYPKDSQILKANTQTSELWGTYPNLKELVTAFKIRPLSNPHDHAQEIFNKFLTELRSSEEEVDWSAVSQEKNILSHAQLNTLFVDTLKSVNIPSREVLGILWAENSNSYRLWQWAEIYLEGVGWTPVDISLSSINRQSFWLKTSENHIKLAPVPNQWNPITLQGEMLSLKTVFDNQVSLAGKPWLYENVKRKGSLRLSSYTTESLDLSSRRRP